MDFYVFLTAVWIPFYFCGKYSIYDWNIFFFYFLFISFKYHYMYVIKIVLHVRHINNVTEKFLFWYHPGKLTFTTIERTHSRIVYSIPFYSWIFLTLYSTRNLLRIATKKEEKFSIWMEHNRAKLWREKRMKMMILASALKA